MTFTKLPRMTAVAGLALALTAGVSLDLSAPTPAFAQGKEGHGGGGHGGGHSGGGGGGGGGGASMGRSGGGGGGGGPSLGRSGGGGGAGPAMRSDRGSRSGAGQTHFYRGDKDNTARGGDRSDRVRRGDRGDRADRGDRDRGDVRRRGGHDGDRPWRRGHRYSWGPGVYFYLYDGYYYGDCSWLRRKALDTGSRYWWRRYRLCREG